MSVTIFFCYAHEDEALLKKLKAHLVPLQRQRLIDLWHDRDISAGSEWEQEISQHLNAAQIILLLVSPDFMASEYCYSKEMQRAIERHERGEALVIPVILRYVYWQGVLGKLQALPTDAKPIVSSSWHNMDEAFWDVTEGIRKVVEKFTTKPSIIPVVMPVQPKEFAMLRTLKGDLQTVYGIALSPDGQTLVSGSRDKTIKVWNLHTGELLRTLRGHSSTVYCVALSPDGKLLISGSDDNSIKIWGKK